MKWFLNPCRRHHANICLLAGGMLSEPEMSVVRAHLAECEDCRKYHDEIKTVTAPLTGWEKHFAHIEPGVAVQTRLTKAIQSTGSPKFIHLLAPKILALECWQQLIHPYRRVWAGLAAVWLLLVIINVSQRDRSPAVAMTSAPGPGIILSFRQQERLLTELMGPDESRAAEPATPLLPQPSSERRLELLMT